VDTSISATVVGAGAIGARAEADGPQATSRVASRENSRDLSMDPEQFIFMISLPVDEPQAASDALASAVGIITATQRDERDDNVDTPTQVLMVAIGRVMRMALG
jgi:hypothetical protein